MSPFVPELPADCDVLRAALAYAAAGWYVLPIDPTGKHAGSVLGKRWQDQTSRDPQQVVAWFAGTAYGLALHVGRSGAVAFDVDLPDAAPAVLAKAIKIAQPPHQSTRADIPGRGHFLFAAPAGSVGNSLGDLPTGWGEVRGLNGIVVVQPTPHEKATEGGRYAWLRTGELSALPDNLAQCLRPPGAARTVLDEPTVRDWVAGLSAGTPSAQVAAVAITMPETGRHGEMNKRVMQLVRLGEQGHPGVPGALVAIRDAFIATVGEDRAGEFRRGLIGAVGEVLNNPTPELPDVDVSGEFAELVARRTTSDPFDEPATVEGEVSSSSLDPVVAMRGELLTSAQIAERSAPVALVRGLLFLDTLAWLIGKSGSFKSFVALDIAQHVAADRKWAQRRVRQARVLYLVAEGAGGMTLRVRAWRLHNGEPSENLLFLPRPVQANSPEWGVLVELAHQLEPGLIVIDTQARVTVGIKENDNTEMGMFIQQVDRLRRATGACVLLVHHIGRNGEDARGASAIDGAQDTELKIERVSGSKSMTARLVTDKQKDGPDTESVDFEMITVDLGADEETGEPITSLAVSTTVFVDPSRRPWEDDLPTRLGRILDVLHEQFSENGATGAQVLSVLTERGWSKEYKKNTFYRAWNELQKKDLIERIAGTQRWLPASAIP